VNVWLLFGVIIVACVLVATAMILIADRVIPSKIGKEHNSTLSPFLTTVALVYGALLGFTVVVAWEQFSSAEANVANEASTLATMYRQTVAMPAQEQQEIRVLLRRYTTAVQGPEWRQQEQNEGGGPSDTARSAITDMYRVLGRQDPDAGSSAINSEFLGQLTVLASQRNTRILDAEPRIPWLLWFGLIFGGVLLVGLAGFLRLDSTRGHIVLSGAVSLLLGLLLFVIYCLDHPFGNQIGITPAPFQHSVGVFDAVDEGT
jgi:Protein of unknown function (DUF4239)